MTYVVTSSMVRNRFNNRRSDEVTEVVNKVRYIEGDDEVDSKKWQDFITK